MEKYAKKWPLGTKREAGAGNGGRPVPGVVCVVHGCALDTPPIPFAMGLWLMRLLLVWTKWGIYGTYGCKSSAGAF